MPYDETAPITIPKFADKRSHNLQDAYTALWYFREGLKTDDHYCAWADMASDLGRKSPTNPHPFTPFDSATRLRDEYDPNLLRFPIGQPNANRHRLPLQCFARPQMLFDAINDCERRHNDAMDAIPLRNAAIKKRRENGDDSASAAAGVFLEQLPWPGVKVELTQMPDDATPIGVGAMQTRTTYQEGDVIPMPDGSMVELVRDKATGRLKRVPVEDAPTSPPTAPKATSSTQSRPGASARRTPPNPVKSPGRNHAQATPKDEPSTLEPVGSAPGAAKATRGHEPA